MHVEYNLRNLFKFHFKFQTWQQKKSSLFSNVINTILFKLNLTKWGRANKIENLTGSIWTFQIVTKSKCQSFRYFFKTPFICPGGVFLPLRSRHRSLRGTTGILNGAEEFGRRAAHVNKHVRVQGVLFHAHQPVGHAVQAVRSISILGLLQQLYAERILDTRSVLQHLVVGYANVRPLEADVCLEQPLLINQSYPKIKHLGINYIQQNLPFMSSSSPPHAQYSLE